MARSFKGKKNVKRSKRSSGGKRKLTLSATNTLAPLPARYISKHKYSQPLQLNLINNFQYLFNLNSLFDPDRTGTGHQPYGFDQLAALYNRYRVIKCNYVISGIQQDTPGTNVRIAAQPSNAITTFPTASAMCESPRTKFIIQGAIGSPLKVLKGSVNLPSLMGRTTAEYMADDRYSADVTTSPAEFAILNIMSGTMTDGGATINCLLTLEYVVEWFDINQLGQS